MTVVAKRVGKKLSRGAWQIFGGKIETSQKVDQY